MSACRYLVAGSCMLGLFGGRPTLIECVRKCARRVPPFADELEPDSAPSLAGVLMRGGSWFDSSFDCPRYRFAREWFGAWSSNWSAIRLRRSPCAAD